MVIDEKLNEDERDTILTNLQKLTNNRLEISSNGEVTIKSIVAKKDLRGEERWLENGNSLINSLVKNKQYTTTITTEALEEAGTNRHKAKRSVHARNGTVTDSTIFFNVGKISGKRLVDNGEKNVWESPQSHIVLGHELIHAQHSMAGNTINDKVNYSYIDSNKITMTELVRKEELSTVGIISHKGHSITENDLRREQGLYPRVKY